MKERYNIKGVYFIGIGGIGMSAIARYFRFLNIEVAGYDRSSSAITLALESEGCKITFEDDSVTVPPLYKNIAEKDSVLIVYTPAIPKDNSILSFFRSNGYELKKRSEILGEISRHTDTLAVSGTHGKTTVSTMLAHILTVSSIGCSAFLGGISKNYNTNLLTSASRYTVIEADEFDRSFHRLTPSMAIVTAMDADHLDIYGTQDVMIEAYNEFLEKIRRGGKLVIHEKIRHRARIAEWVDVFSYGLDEGSDFRAVNIVQESGTFTFDLVTPEGTIEDIKFPFPGKVNIENAVAASSVALLCGVKPDEIRSSLFTFRGVQRRFDIRIDRPGLVYIDDYAHHPEEIRACINSVREYYAGRKITGIFQPHLYSRTSDHADGFAQILDTLDEVILLPIYPAREKPMPGVSSLMILERMKNGNKKLLKKSDIPSGLDIAGIDVLLTIGAGDIDRLVRPIEDELNLRRK
ncbi:MAG TPA: UDP-N-acetylmuramate--L-alanine ligase [Bacteroidales bacterium]|nr:UDP-N-acetylmuramate--L-alanine ligase [Bacteroidales bacterium]